METAPHRLWGAVVRALNESTDPGEEHIDTNIRKKKTPAIAGEILVLKLSDRSGVVNHAAVDQM